jgi:hypothetical protein
MQLCRHGGAAFSDQKKPRPPPYGEWERRGCPYILIGQTDEGCKILPVYKKAFSKADLTLYRSCIHGIRFGLPEAAENVRDIRVANLLSGPDATNPTPLPEVDHIDRSRLAVCMYLHVVITMLADQTSFILEHATHPGFSTSQQPFIAIV